MKKLFIPTIIFAFILFLGLSNFALAQTQQHLYKIDPGAGATTIDRHGECRRVSNQSGNPSTLTPTGTALEWEYFRLYRPGHVDLSACCTRNNPTISILPSSQSGSRGTQLNYTVYVTNNDSSACGSSNFSLTITTRPSGFTCSLVSNNLSISPGSQPSTTIRVTSSSTASSGNHTFSVRATNSGATSYNSQASAIYSITCQCTSGACCDGCNFRPTSHACNSYTEYQYRCSTTACGGTAQRGQRTVTQYCSGNSASCAGSLSYGSWSSWTNIQSCSSNQRCTTDGSSYAYCYNDASCAPACVRGTCSSLGYNCGSHSDGCGGTINCGSCSGSTSCGHGTCSSNQRPSWYCSGGQCGYSCYNDSNCQPTCSCLAWGPWQRGLCGWGGCDIRLRYEYRTRSCTPPSCAIALDKRCVIDPNCGWSSCSCREWGDWYNVGCGGGNCSSAQMLRERVRYCDPPNCMESVQRQCVANSSCTIQVPCQCTFWSSWSQAGCGNCGCAYNEHCWARTRTCNPPRGCQSEMEYFCNRDSSCR